MYDGDLDQLEALVRRLDVGADRATIVQMLAIRDLLSAKTVTSIGQFDVWSGWELDDAPTLAGWLCQHGGCSRPEANRLAASARRLHQLPVTARAWTAGDLRGAHVDAVVANTTDRSVALFADHEHNVVPSLATLDARDATKVMQRWAVSADAILADIEPTEPEQSLHASRTIGNRLEITASLVGNDALHVEAALRLAERDDSSLAPAARRAEALGRIAEFYVTNQMSRLGGRHRPHVNVVIDIDRLGDHDGARTLDGIPVDPSTAAALCCDASIHRVVMAGRSTVLDLGTATRSVPAPMFAGLVLRDGGCRIPGCDRGPRWCHAHHLWAWEDGGPTALWNLALLCSYHHHKAHRHGWHMKLLPDGELHITKPDGSVLVSEPRSP